MIIITEKRDLLNSGEKEWELPDIMPLDEEIIPLPPPSAEQLFLEKFREYSK